MPFPDLTLRTDPNAPASAAPLWAEATGVPDDGDNTFGLPFVGAGTRASLVDGDWLRIRVERLDDEVLSFAEGSPLLSVDRRSMTLQFAQTGVGQATVTVQLLHSQTR